METEAMTRVTMPQPSGTTHKTRRKSPVSSAYKRTVPGVGWRANGLRMLHDPVVSLLNLHREFGDVVALGPEKSAAVCAFSPELNHQILTDTKLFYNLDVSNDASLIRMPRDTSIARLLSGVAGMNGEKHTQHRHLLLPGFKRNHINPLRDSLTACVETYIETWAVGQELDLGHEMIELSLSLAISGLLGLNPVNEGHRVRDALAVWSSHGLSPAVALLPFNLPGLPYRRFLAAADTLEAEFIAVIERKRRLGLSDSDALSLLLSAQDEHGDVLSPSDVLGHLTTFFTAGHETSASALTWIFFLLAQHPDVHSDLYDELWGVLHGDAPQIDQLASLPLLQHVIDEGLRMFPPSMWLLRTTTDTCVLGARDVPKGTHIIFSPAVTHYREDVFERPHEFIPSRWETIDPTPYEYLPFGAGPRRCLGASFATLEMQIAVALIIQRFRLVVPQGTRVDRGGTILSLPRHRLPLVLHSTGTRATATQVRGNIHYLVSLPQSR